MRIREAGKRKDTTKVYQIPDGLFPGQQVMLRGRVPWGSKSFSINFSATPRMGEGDILFHLNPRPSEGVCIRNALLNGSWGAEEKWQPYFPFDDGRSFSVKIEVTKDAFRTFVNGRPFVDFLHRTDFRAGKYLILREGAEYYDVIFQSKPNIPLTTAIHNGMRIGKTIRIRGMCTAQDGFAINFNDNRNNIYFHFNARPAQRTVVRNSYFGSWGNEETATSKEFPFYPFLYFDASFVCMEDKFAVYVNDEHFIDFAHRGNPNNISVLQIKGSVNVLDTECLEPMGEDAMTEVDSGLENGDLFVLNGLMTERGKTFAVNFLNGFTENDDIALHFNPRKTTGEVVLNSRYGGAWQSEEKVALPGVFWSNRPFQVKVETKRNKFKIYVNGVDLAKYKIRGNVEDVHAVQVKGDVFLLETLLLKRLIKPVWERLTGGIRPGTWVTLQGTPKKNWQQFVVNFALDDTLDGDIAFHFNVRRGARQVVRNHRQSGAWGREETVTPFFAFDSEATFEIVFFVKEEKFLIYFNGKLFFEFVHRVPVERITHIYMDGDCNFYEPEVVI
uniref:Uncharacterized protein LOC111128968 n=1 Tax=Crassostrea virginica TaxID=6565 RepID=A0A8B8DSZ2_CRAVI|nr:uncharacterized protein LOC111128968 [Crassostrea virginica]